MLKISPSQIQKYRRCPRAYAWEYVAGIKSPPSPKQEFGSAVHAELAEWLSRAQPPSDTPPGRIARQAISKNWLPTPSPRLLVEKEFSLPINSEIELIGFIDCVEPPIKDKVPIVIDHKTTSDLKWALTVEELAQDPQALIYGAWAMLEFQVPIVECRWIYYAASNPLRGARRAAGSRPVSVLLDLTSETFVLNSKKLEKNIKEITDIRKNARAPTTLRADPASCDRYGGCYYRENCKLSGLDKLEAAIKKEIVK